MEKTLFIKEDSKIQKVLKYLPFIFIFSVIVGFSQLFELFWLKYCLRITDECQKVVSLTPGKYRCGFNEPDLDEPQNTNYFEEL